MSTGPVNTMEQTEVPMWRSSPHKGLHLRLFKNGDLYFPGKLVTLNKKQSPTFESWLSELSHSMSLNNGAIWRVYTPRNGTRKVDFDDLQDGQSLVVAGQENFKKLRYDQITAVDKKKAPPFKYDADPVYHNRQFLSSGKINKIETHSVLIKVWPNGGDLRGPRRVLLSPRIRPFTLENVLTQVNEMLKEDCLGTVEKLYMLNGIKVSDVGQIVPNGQYVACRKTERFKKAKYHDQGVKNLATSPRLERKFLAPLHPRSNNSTNQSTPEHSNESTQNSVHSYPFRQKILAREENDFPPVKQTRSTEKTNKNVDYDSDHGGVFKAKQSNKSTLDAKEVPDSRQTKTDYPIDLQKAKEVEVEKIRTNESKQTNKGNNDIDKKSLATHKIKQEEIDERAQSATRIQAGYRSYKARQADASKTEKNSGPKNIQPSSQQYNDEEKAVARIQAGFRGYQTRKNFSKIKNEKVEKEGKPDKNDKPTKKKEQHTDEKERAAAKIQAGFRGYQTRIKQQKQKEKEEEAALRIQSGYHSYQTKKKNAQNTNDNVKPKQDAHKDNKPKQDIHKDNKPKQDTHKDNKPKQDTHKDNKPKQDTHRNPEEDLWEQEEWAATKIQTAYRGYAARKMNSGRSEESSGKSNSSKHDEAAATIQAAFKTHLTKKSLKSQNLYGRRTSEKDASVGQETYQENAASKIQACYRGYRTRTVMNTLLGRLTEENSAAVIQAAYRSHISRQKNKSNIDTIKKEINAAEIIQACFRSHLYRQRNNLKINTEEEKINAAEKIQAGYRSYTTRQHLGKLLSYERENRAAYKIQSSYRDYKNRKHMNQNNTESMNNAALKIQAGYRGYRSRKIHKNYEKNRAAKKIQALYHSYHGRKLMKEKEEYVSKIQAAFRGHHLRQQVKRENIAAAKIQSSYRHFKARDRNNLKTIPSNNIKEKNEALGSSEVLKQKQDAAQTIQKHYRAYRNRKL